MVTTLTKIELKEVVKDSIREVLEKEIIRIRALMTPYVSSQEQKEIEKLYKRPSKKIKKSLKINL